MRIQIQKERDGERSALSVQVIMKTQQQAKDCFVNSPIGNEGELKRIFASYSCIQVADIGACDGLSTVRYAKMFPNATFHCFEPIDYNVVEIRRNVNFYGVGDRVRVHRVALSDLNGNAKMYVSSGQSPRVTTWDTGNKSSSLLKPTGHIKAHPWCRFCKRLVKTARLDDLLPGTTFHFAHIDVQGAELAVLRGGGQVFKNTLAFWIEVAKKELYAGQPLKSDIVAYMEKMGCKCTLDTCGGDYGDMFFER